MSYKCFLLENLIMHLLAMLHLLCTHWLLKFTSFKHYIVSAKTGLTPCGLNPVFVLKSKATRVSKGINPV